MADVFTVLGQDHQEVKRMLAELVRRVAATDWAYRPWEQRTV